MRKSGIVRPAVHAQEVPDPDCLTDSRLDAASLVTWANGPLLPVNLILQAHFSVLVAFLDPQPSNVRLLEVATYMHLTG